MAFTQTMFNHVSKREVLFSLNWSKFAVKSDWISMNKQMFKIWSFSGKQLGFSERNLETFRNCYKWQIFAGMRLERNVFFLPRKRFTA